MASTRSQSTRSTRSKTLNSSSADSVTSMEVDEVVSGLQQLSRGATDFSKSVNNTKDKMEEAPAAPSEAETNCINNEINEPTTTSSFSNLLDAAASASTTMDTDPLPPVESSSDPGSSDSCPDSSDSEDSSETDEETAAKNKLQDQEDLQTLEKMFLYARELSYDERMQAVNTKLEEVRFGKAKDYLEPLDQLQKIMGGKTEMTSMRRGYQLENLKHKTEAEEIAALQNYENEKTILHDNLKLHFENKIRRLKEDRHNDFASEFLFGTIAKKKSKKSLDIFGEKKKKACVVSGPYIVYMLHEGDIMEDWASIKKVLSAPKRKFDPIVF